MPFFRESPRTRIKYLLDYKCWARPGTVVKTLTSIESNTSSVCTSLQRYIDAVSPRDCKPVFFAVGMKLLSHQISFERRSLIQGGVTLRDGIYLCTAGTIVAELRKLSTTGSRIRHHSTRIRKNSTNTRVCEFWYAHPPFTGSHLGRIKLRLSQAAASKHRSPHCVRVRVTVRVGFGWSAS